MSELSFLIDLLLNHKLSKDVKALVSERIKLIENQKAQSHMFAHPIQAAIQSPSTLANLARDMNQVGGLAIGAAPVPVTAPVAQALVSRQQAIQAAMSDKPEVGRSSPRKF